jgi:hypothetical protein
MKFAIIVALLLIASGFAADVIQVSINPNNPIKEINDYLFGMTQGGRWIDYRDTLLSPRVQLFSKTYRGILDSLGNPDPLYVELFKNAGISVLGFESWEPYNKLHRGRAGWQTWVGKGDSGSAADTLQREELGLRFTTYFSQATLSDILVFCDSIGAALLINYNDFLDTSYFYTDSAIAHRDTIPPWPPDTQAILADLDLYLRQSSDTEI